jgi:hypothetical protein
LNYAPIVAFLLIYVFTCLLGALLLLADYRPFIRLFGHFSGTRVPSLDASQSVTVLMLLCAAPFCLCLGYALARRVPMDGRWSAGLQTRVRSMHLDPPWWVPFVVFGISGAIAFVSLARAGGLSFVSAWLNYGSFISAREEIFSRVGFLEFVNIYIFLPFSAAWVLITYRRSGLRALIVRWLPLAWTEFIDLLLFQKKSAVVSLLIVGFAWLFFRARTDISRRRLVRGASLTAALGLVIFFAAVVVPEYGKASKSTVCVSGADKCSGSGQVPALLAYSVLTPITRGSAPVLYYPIVYPKVHPYYGVDLFQDEIGLPSAFPDDNRVIWHAQYPHHPNGTSVAPFQFSLYSGDGLVATLVECLIIGLLMGFGWRLITSRLLPPVWSSLLAASECLFGVYLAIDSWRNDTTVSYGALWALFFIGVAGLAVHLFSDHARRLRSRQGAAVFGALVLVVFVVSTHDYGGAPSYVRAATHSVLGRRPGKPIRAASGTGLPRGWSVAAPGVRVASAIDGPRLTTTLARHGYQIESPSVTLSPGTYVASVTGRVIDGGIDVGVVGGGDQRWIRQATFRAQTGITVMEVPFTLFARTHVRMILANNANGGPARSHWLVAKAMLTSPASSLTNVWRGGLK